MRLSVVIPTWREAARIGAAVRAGLQIADDVIVADAASPDGTADLAAAAGASIVLAPKGRGAQLHQGALAARGDVLLFLHADVDVPPDARTAVEEALRQPDVLGGNFLLRFEPATPAARFFSWANDVRRRRLGIYYGDSGLFVRRAVYHDLGGFRPYPLFEDYDFARRLEAAGRTAYLRKVVVRASARRFATAPVKALFGWTVLQALFSVGIPPARLAAWYRDIRGPG